MNSTTYPVEILNLLGSVQEYAGSDIWSDVLNHSTTERDRELTKTLCSADCSDFVVMDGRDAFLFVSNDQTGDWTVNHVGQPIYEIEPEMIGDDSVDFDGFLKELQHELKGVEVKRGSALNNLKSEFVQQFKDELDKAFQTTLESC